MAFKNNLFSTLTVIYLLIVCLISPHASFGQLDVVRIIDQSIDESKKEAILILPGFGDSKKGR